MEVGTRARSGSIVHILLLLATLHGIRATYYGKSLGRLSELHHGVSGEVFAIDARTLYLKDFTYDGQAPAAYFYAGNSRTPGNGGFQLKDEKGSTKVIRRYRKEGLVLTLPEGKTLGNVKWFSVWCEEFEVNFGDVKIPRNFDYPRPRKIDALKGVHGVSSDNIVIVDAQTLLVPNFSYDGEAPDAKFWVGRGSKPSPQGIRVHDENGKEIPLRRYDRKTIVLTLPGDLTVFDIGHFGVWCEAFTVDFGHIQIPSNLNVPPSLKMLGVSPQSKLNCEVLYDDLAFEVRWAVAGESIVLQLVSKLEDNEYMSFGISGNADRSVMVGGDVVVAWVDKETLKGYAEDYYLDAKSQCSGPSGSCPDTRLEENTDSIRLLNAAVVNGYSIVTYQRPLKESDQLDKPFLTNESQAIIWAIGPLNQRREVSFHSVWSKSNRFIDFGRSPTWNCPKPESEQPAMKVAHDSSNDQEVTRNKNPQEHKRRGESNRKPSTTQPTKEDDTDTKDTKVTAAHTRQPNRRGTTTTVQSTQKIPPTPAPVAKIKPWDIPPIHCNEPEDGVLYAQMGPTGGKHGYSAITGHVGWGISWYINGLLIPEINIVRGRTYTFVVEGGLDPEVPAKYHPFYITDDPIGGYQHKTDEEKSNVKIYAGVKKSADGSLYPTGVGRLCHWTHEGDSDADDFESFGAYQRTLELKCDQGEPGIIQFTPDESTPDTLYYQCFTHRYLGWKINILDTCDSESQASETEQTILTAPVNDREESLSDVDLEDSPSIRVETKIKAPNSLKESEPEKDKIQAEKIKSLQIDDINSEKEDTIEDFLKTKDVEEISTTTLKIEQESSTKSELGQFLNPITVLDQLPLSETEIPIIIQPAIPSNIISTPIIVQNLPTSFDTHLVTTYTFEEPPETDRIHEIEKVDTIPTETTTVLTTTTTSTTRLAPETLQTLQTKSAPLNKTHFVLTNSKINHKKEPFGSSKVPLPHTYAASSSIGKKPIISKPLRPIVSNPMFLTPIPMQSVNRPPTLIFMKRPPPILPPQSHLMMIKNPPLGVVYHHKHLSPSQMNVKVSPLQASTEKESLGTSERPPLPLIHSISGKVHYSNQFLKDLHLTPARNTGFRPETVVVEGGFKPIVSKEIFIDKRIDDGPELEYESEIGIINVSGQEVTQPFGPVFVPSPMESTTQVPPPKPEKTKYTKKKASAFWSNRRRIGSFYPQHRIMKTLDSDEVAEAAERVDSYYLPPDNQSVRPLSQQALQPSNIDIPPGTVVSFDGKKVSGVSLTAKDLDARLVLDSRFSKAAELVKFVPQVGPFKGELPPLDPKLININVPQLYNQGFINRDLESPSLDYLPQDNVERRDSSKLINEKSGSVRNKRSPHHTPEHTLQQSKKKFDLNDSKGSSHITEHFSLIILCTGTLVNMWAWKIFNV